MISQRVRDGIIVFDSSLSICFFNQSASAIFGYAESEALGRPISLIFPRDLIDRHRDHLSRESGFELNPPRLIVPANHKHGHSLQAEISLTPFASGSEHMVIAIVRELDLHPGTPDSRQDAFTQQILDAMPAHVAILDSRARIVSVNAAWRFFAERNRGSQTQTSEGMNYLEVCDRAAKTGSRDAAQVRDALTSLLAGNAQTFQFEYPCHAPSELRWFRMRAVPFHWRQERHIAVIHENVSNRVTAEIRTQEVENLLQTSGRMARLGGWKLELATGLIHATTTMLDMLGMPARTRLTWPSLRAHLPPSTRRKIQHAVLSSLRDRKPFELQFQTTGPDQKQIWVKLAGEPTFHGAETIAVSGMLQDITQTVFRENILRREQQRLSAALKISRQGIFEINLDSGEVHWDERAFEMHGVHPYSFIPTIAAIETILIAEDRGLGKRLKQFRDNGGRTWHERYRVHTPTGEIQTIEVLGTFLAEAGDVRRLLVGTAKDVTAREAIQAELLAAREQAEAATVAKSRFLANMSHEIRTPMTGILGFLRLLQGSELGQEQRSYVDLAVSAASSLGRILDDVLDFSRIEAGMLRMEPAPVKIGELVQECAALFSATARDHETVIELEQGPEASTSVMADSVRLKQILNNLIGNAVKFTKKGTIRIRVSGSRDSDQLPLRIEVADTGIGISPDRMGEIFQPFAQADSSTTRQYGGTGLGLTISRELTAMMGGALTVRPNEPAGTIFEFSCSFPLANDEMSPAQVPQLPASLPGSRILVADDNELNRLCISLMLKERGLTCDLAQDGHQALEAAQEKDYDIIFMDCQMPGIDGYTATRRLREIQKTHRPAIIALTANAMQGEREKCLSAGMDDYITKPIDFEQMFELIKEYSRK